MISDFDNTNSAFNKMEELKKKESIKQFTKDGFRNEAKETTAIKFPIIHECGREFGHYCEICDLEKEFQRLKSTNTELNTAWIYDQMNISTLQKFVMILLNKKKALQEALAQKCRDSHNVHNELECQNNKCCYSKICELGEANDFSEVVTLLESEGEMK
jgi:hypothetical protein